jgi:hypothetical protein
MAMNAGLKAYMQQKQATKQTQPGAAPKGSAFGQGKHNAKKTSWSKGKTSK